MKTIRLTAKCSDMFSASLIKDGKQIGEYNGYVPAWFPNPSVAHYGDYVELEIDVATGQIINWKTPSSTNLDAAFVKGEDE